jgi:hypothetical protein
MKFGCHCRELLNKLHVRFVGIFHNWVSRRHTWRSLNGLSNTIYIFIYSLFKDAFSSSDYIAWNERMIVNYELERLWKEEVVA